MCDVGTVSHDLLETTTLLCTVTLEAVSLEKESPLLSFLQQISSLMTFKGPSEEYQGMFLLDPWGRMAVCLLIDSSLILSWNK